MKAILLYTVQQVRTQGLTMDGFFYVQIRDAKDHFNIISMDFSNVFGNSL